jgi:hypothetical protein
MSNIRPRREIKKEKEHEIPTGNPNLDVEAFWLRP